MRDHVQLVHIYTAGLLLAVTLIAFGMTTVFFRPHPVWLGPFVSVDGVFLFAFSALSLHTQWEMRNAQFHYADTAAIPVQKTGNAA